MADGGDGTLAVLAEHLDLSTITVPTEDPLGRPMAGTYLLGKRAAFIELAAASGLVLLREAERNPLKTSTYGTGLLLADAFKKDVDTVYLLLGGSATHDVGTGIMRAMGVRFLTFEGKEVVSRGDTLADIRELVLPSRKAWLGKQIVLLCDVNNPLVGPRGAARVYAAQKGADAAMIERLEAGARSFGVLLNKLIGKEVLSLPGGGAAGGIAAGLYAMLGAELRPGFTAISALTGLEASVSWADQVVTGEGRLDTSSSEGKVVGDVLELCKKYNKKCAVVVGDSALPAHHPWPGHLASVYTLVERAGSAAAAMRDAAQLLQRIGAELYR